MGYYNGLIDSFLHPFIVLSERKCHCLSWFRFSDCHLHPDVGNAFWISEVCEQSLAAIWRALFHWKVRVLDSSLGESGKVPCILQVLKLPKHRINHEAASKIVCYVADMHEFTVNPSILYSYIIGFFARTRDCWKRLRRVFFLESTGTKHRPFNKYWIHLDETAGMILWN